MDKLTEDAVREIEQIHSSWIEFEVAGEDHSLMAFRGLDGLAMAAATLQNALIIQAVAAPAIFGAVYFRHSASSSPLSAAAQCDGVHEAARRSSSSP
jgi:hypothetical protein